jgi:hypothetical protein
VSTCKEPCWQGIKPGSTTFREATEILGRTYTAYEHGKEWPGWSYASWGEVSILNYKGESINVPQVEMLCELGIVRKIEITIPDSRETLADIVIKYGPPEAVSIGALHFEAPYWHVGLFYPSKGIIFASKYATVMGNWDNPHVSKRDIVESKIFIQPTTIEAIQANSYYQHGSAPYPASDRMGPGDAWCGLTTWENIPD